MTSMKSIYKACVLTGTDTVDRIVVFCGADAETDLTLLDPRTNQPVFSEAERTAIENKNTKVVFSTQQIHPDDTISTIKYKIASELERALRIEEIYLFCLRSEAHAPDDFYRALTQNKRSQLTRARLRNALNNFKGKGLETHPDAVVTDEKEGYRYEDVVKLKVISGDREVNTAHMLGQRLFLMNNSFPTSFNPFDELVFDKLLVSAAANSMTTTNGGLLLDSGAILDGVIYVCLATDVLDNVVRTSAQVTDQYLLAVYFPLLAAQNMRSKAAIEAAPERVEIKSDGDAFNTFAHEDLLHRAHRDMASSPFAWEHRGVAEIKIAIHQKFTLKVPLDVIFKLIPTHPGAPLTKLNPGGHRENMYRIYGDTTSTDGRKIPILSRTTIHHLVVDMGGTKGVSVYFALDKEVFLTCNFEENGDIIVYGKFAIPLSIEDVTDLIARHVTPLIKTVEPFFVQSGYKHANFGSLSDKHVEIVHMDYVSIATTDTDVSSLSIQPIHNCIAPMFVVDNPEVGADDGAHMRYRKVSNFNSMTGPEAFLISQVKRKTGFNKDTIIQQLVDNFPPLTENDARELVARAAANITMDNARITKIRTNPGFLTVVSDATEKGLRSSGRISVSVSGIDNMRYIPMIDEYVGVLLRLLLDRDATNAQFPTMVTACTAPVASVEAVAAPHLEDVLGATDRGIMDQQDVTIKDDEVVEVDAVPIAYDDVAVADAPPRAMNALDLLYDDDDEDDPDYISDDDAEGQQGGTTCIRGGARNIIGMSLKNPSIFMTAMDEAEPDLFIKTDVGNFKRYSRSCSASYGRQPVIITQEEHADMVAAERAGIIERYGSDAFYELDADAQAAVILQESETDDRYTVSYGTNADKQYVYICPRYWCLKTNTFIHPKDMETVMENGKEVLRHPTCGGVIPRGQSKVKDDGNYVYEFTGDGRRTGGQYANQYPGFHDPSQHPEGYCQPCCYTLHLKDGEAVFTSQQKARRKQCVVAPPTDKDVPEDTSQPVPRRRPEGQYIMDQNTSPIAPGRWAYLNIEIQHFFKVYAIAYQVPNAPTQLRPQVRALLRHGVEPSATQSFLACMSDIMFFGVGKEDKPLAEFKEYLAAGLTLEAFAGLQNGNLVTTFADTEQTTSAQLDEVDVSEHSDSPLRQRNAEQKTVHSFAQLILAFRRFRAYLRSPTAVIDHTYTWDLVCAPGVHASHPEGINLIILEIPEADSTTNVSIMCPSNHYSTQQFSSNRPSVFIIKRDGTFEPVFSYDRNGADKESKYTAYFHTAGADATAPPSVVAAINNIVKPLHNRRCVPLQSMRNTHVFQQPILLDALLLVLNEKRDTQIVIQRQVLNFSHKIVGLEVNIGNVTGYVPCYPSGHRMRLTAPTTFMDDMTLYHTYVDTIFFSDLVARTFGIDVIPMRPAYKIVDEEMIIGILTVTDQFIMFSEPIELSTANDDIPILRQTGRIDVEADLRNKVTTRDEERIVHVNKIRLETNFFLAYRNTVRILLNDYANIAQRVEIEERIADAFVPHHRKLETVVRLLGRLIGPSVRFATDMDPSMIQDVSVCINRQPQQCTAANPVCVIDSPEDGDEDESTCALVIPKTNLVSPNVDNEIVYINKLADQLIRYTRIRKYMMDPTQFLSFGQAHYDLGEHEFVVAQTVLKNEYFTDLVARKTGSGEYMGNYDETNPDARHRMEHVDTFNEAEVKAIAAHPPAKLKIKRKI